MQWTEKYSPKKLGEVAGNPTPVGEIQKWADNWDGTALLLVGNSGTGKTAAAYALVNSMDWEVLEMNASDLRNENNVKRIAGLASSSLTFSGKKRMILFDEVDEMFRQDRGGAKVVLQLIKEANSPIILTANDAYSSSLSSIRKACTKLDFKKIHYATIKKVLEHICENEGIQAKDEALIKISKSVEGDLKAAINDLQALAQGKTVLEETDVWLTERDRTENIFNSIRTIFKTNSFKDSLDAFNKSEEDPNFFMKWVEENIPREYEDPEDLNHAFEAMSKADKYNARIIRRQNWSLLKFNLVFMTAGVSLAKKETYKKFTPYAFPTMINTLSRSKGKRALKKEVCSKIGEIIHASPHEVSVDYLPYLKELFKQKPAEYTAQFDFEEKHVEYFGFTPGKSKKILGQAKEIRDEAIAKTIRVEEHSNAKQKSLNSFF